ncbi:MAG: radical SAM protein [Clostridiales bacterium]|nr:radical SAM protein [Clostridiales bacterium]
MAEQILETESLCPECLNKIPAVYERDNNKVYLKKACKDHGDYRVLVWSDANQYLSWSEQSVHAQKVRGGYGVKRGCPFDCGLCRDHEGRTCTAVLEITYRCNMECRVCFADTKKASYEPPLNKVMEMYRAAYQNGGHCSIQLSGGEPTLREDLADILKMGKGLGFTHIQVNTNGIKIAQSKEYLQSLKDAGADLIYLQFDGTKDEIYKEIRGRSMWEIKQQAVENCEKVGIGIILVPTIIRKINDHNIGDIIQFAKEHMPTVKGVHFQPVSFFGRFPGKVPKDEDRMNLSDIIFELQKQTKGEISSEHIVPRKRYDPHCAFSSLFYLTEQGKLKALTKENQNMLLDNKTDFAKKANEFTNAHWRMPKEGENKTNGPEMSSFIDRLRNYTLTVTGMGFQDVWNIDIGRLKGCCVHVVTANNRVAPLCAFHVTSTSGVRLYKNG